MHAFAWRASILVLALSAACSLASATCRQNQGRPCTSAELSHPLLSPTLASGPLPFPTSKELRSRFDLAKQTDFKIWRFINPAICVHDGALWALIRMWANGPKAPTVCPDNNPTAARQCPSTPPVNAVSFTTLLRLGKTFDDVVQIDALPYDLPYDAVHEGFEKHKAKLRFALNFGPEDPRAFTWDGEIYMAFNALSNTEVLEAHFGRRMHVQRVFPSISAPVQLRPWHHPHGQQWEKNWAPISEVASHNGISDYLFARFLEPHQILQCNHLGKCKEAASTSQKAYFESLKARNNCSIAFHLGTNAVRINETHFGAIMHQGCQQKYFNFPYLFEAKHPWSVAAVSTQPMDIQSVLPKDLASHVFVSGLSFVDGRLVVAYGDSNQEPRFVLLSVNEVFGAMDRIWTHHEKRNEL